MSKERKQPTTSFSVIAFLAIIIVLIIMINMGVNTTLSVFAGVIVAVIATKLLNIPWQEVEQNIIKTAAECMPTFLIVIMVGMLVGIWMAGGTVPSLMYYGMQVISPKILVPLAFVLCSPGIVVSRLQKDNVVSYSESNLNSLKKKYKLDIHLEREHEREN